jgi:hypothetical protein
MGKLLRRMRTILALFRHFLREGRWFLIPFVLILLLAGVLLLLTGGLSYVAPFLYSIF